MNMRKISRTTLFLLLISILSFGCKKKQSCTGDVQMGESVMIPITFIGFAPQEINGIQVTRINNTTSAMDNFRLEKILWAYSAHSDQENITDRAQSGDYGYYDSYLNNSTLILKWDTGSDTLSDFVVRKSKVNVSSECHKDDPNVKVDQVTYQHKGQIVPMNTRITIYK
jgi:hypothetical protein